MKNENDAIRNWISDDFDKRRGAVYGHVIAKFSRMERFPKLCSSSKTTEFSPWLNKMSAENLKK